ncbi:MAG: glutamate--tRNA ligase [Bacteroidota bacterium]|nr:glutamate--tRNA ligase [Bacteroidota bacterium]
MNSKVRVRFAPSPTGPLHIGGVRTALYNYLFAKKHGGDFLLRIEDTDSGRFVPGAEKYIIESLRWCGIVPNEGVGFGDGAHAPYRQSERKELYLDYALQLIDDGFAYYAFDTAEELDALRKEQESQGKAFTYNYQVRTSLSTSLKLSKEDVEERIARGEQWVIRFKMPENEQIRMQDLIRGEVVVNSSTLDDKVLYKSADQLPTYHLANIVDDFMMEITHVIRGEEWLPSLPLHVMLYRALDWEDNMPQFAHLPLLLKPDGKGKLSKRDGDRLGFPVFPLQWQDPKTEEISSGYRESGYFPEAFINMLAFLGWNPGTTQEIFSLDELAEAFSLDHVHKAGARFDFEKAKWYNHQYLVTRSDEDLAADFEKILAEKGISAEHNFVVKVVALVKERVNFVKEMWQQASFFFIAPKSYDADVIKKRWKDNAPALIAEAKDVLLNFDGFDAETIKHGLHDFITEKQANMGAVMNCLRLSLVGSSFGPDLPVIIEMLGKEEVAARIEKAVKTIGI